MLAPSRNLILIYLAAWLRSFTIGLLGVLLGVFLYRRGLSSLAIASVIATGLAAAAAATTVMTLAADRVGRKLSLIVLSLLATLGSIPLIFDFSLPGLLIFAFLGMLNGMGTDRSAAFALEQATIPGLVTNQQRTWSLSWYNVMIDSGGAMGALAAATPVLLERSLHLDLAHAYRYVFVGYAFVNVLSAAAYLFLTRAVELFPSAAPDSRKAEAKVSAETKSMVAKMSSLFAIDSFGGGLLPDALVSYWFFRRFGIVETKLAALFFVVHLLNALSHLGAAWLAHRIGLIKTMVFTHLPSSVFLILVPFAPSAQVAMLLFLLRESLVEMDVPTRQSYVAAVVPATARTFASGITNVTRNVSWAVAASLAGVLMQKVAFSAPLILGGSLKISYDVLLYRAFRHVVPPEERAG